MTQDALQDKLLELIKPTYPNIKIEVSDNDKERHIYFTTNRFADLFPKQRYHYLVHAIPADFYEKHLANTVWHELAPGEHPDDLEYIDDETIAEIKEPIFKIIEESTDFVAQLDKQFTSGEVKCQGDFRYSKAILNQLNFSTEDQFDIFHVMMDEGGFCDCEILYNVFKKSGFAQKYWAAKKH